MVLIFALVIAMLVGAALQSSALEARSAAWRWEAVRARNFAETALELLLRRTAQRWTEGGEYCPRDQYCAADFPVLASLLEEVPDPWRVSVSLTPPSVLPTLRDPAREASSARAYRRIQLEARVRIDGPAPVSLAAGLALSSPAAEHSTP
ncbi:hypothetical protein HRUBRA_01661 [Pseudohaliea rubra DSM 19751]|uniref:Uncharacterized protein n=2 Tax=Pseudohaliea TaxID=1341120 RepID=A0A095WYM7_9GAMM|nr:hypothetical protein HRUBRA_01661 [Pseudohaliea rubra DSM 19751]